MVQEIKLTLNNGLRVRFVKDDLVGPHRNYLWCNLIVGSGSAADPAGRRGLAHVTEHVMRRKIPENERFFSSKLKKAHVARKVTFGAAETLMDYTMYPFGAEIGEYHEIFKYYKAWFDSLPIKDAKYQSACIADVLGEKWKMVEKGPFFDLYDAMYEAAFEGHEYDRVPLGRERDLRKIRPKDVMAFARDHYRLSNMIFSGVIARAPKATMDRVIEEACRVLEKLRCPIGEQTPVRRNLQFYEVPENGFLFNQVHTGSSPSLLMGFKVPRALAWPGAAVLLLSNVIRNSEPLRRRLGEGIDSFSVQLERMEAGGMFEVKTQLKDEVPVSVLKGLVRTFFSECERISSGKWMPEEMEISRRRTLINLENQRKGFWFENQWPGFIISNRSYFDLVGIKDEIRRLGPGEISSVARLLRRERACIATSVDRKSIGL
jgi:hypothetical protein